MDKCYYIKWKLNNYFYENKGRIGIRINTFGNTEYTQWRGL